MRTELMDIIREIEDLDDSIETEVSKAYDLGNNEGYEEGERKGYEDGYEAGYREGKGEK